MVGGEKMIFEGAWYAQAIKISLAFLFIGTFVWYAVTKEWWWNKFKK